MNLGTLIEILQKFPNKQKICSVALGHAISWRGSYDEVGFSPDTNKTVAEMLKEAKSVVGRTFIGYKGGEYVMRTHTPIHIEEYGHWTDGGCVGGFIKRIDNNVDIEGRTEEWLVDKAIKMMLSQ